MAALSVLRRRNFNDENRNSSVYHFILIGLQQLQTTEKAQYRTDKSTSLNRADLVHPVTRTHPHVHLAAIGDRRSSQKLDVMHETAGLLSNLLKASLSLAMPPHKCLQPHSLFFLPSLTPDCASGAPSSAAAAAGFRPEVGARWCPRLPHRRRRHHWHAGCERCYCPPLQLLRRASSVQSAVRETGLC
jgi:hypothetical protein